MNGSFDLGDALFWCAIMVALAIAAGGIGFLLAEKPSFKPWSLLIEELRRAMRRR